MNAMQINAFSVGPSWRNLSSKPAPIRRDIPAAGQVGEYLRYIDESLIDTFGVMWANSQSFDNEDSPMWIEDAYSMCHNGRTDDAVDVLFTHINELLCAGQFERCNDILRTIDIKRLDVTALVAVLSITLAAANSLPFRSHLTDCIRERLAKLEPSRFERLLMGLC